MTLVRVTATAQFLQRGSRHPPGSNKELGLAEGGHRTCRVTWQEGSRSGFETTDHMSGCRVLTAHPQYSWGSGQMGTMPQAGHSPYTWQVSSRCLHAAPGLLPGVGRHLAALRECLQLERAPRQQLAGLCVEPLGCLQLFYNFRACCAGDWFQCEGLARGWTDCTGKGTHSPRFGGEPRSPNRTAAQPQGNVRGTSRGWGASPRCACRHLPAPSQAV